MVICDSRHGKLIHCPCPAPNRAWSSSSSLHVPRHEAVTGQNYLGSSSEVVPSGPGHWGSLPSHLAPRPGKHHPHPRLTESTAVQESDFHLQPDKCGQRTVLSEEIFASQNSFAFHLLLPLEIPLFFFAEDKYWAYMTSKLRILSISSSSPPEEGILRRMITPGPDRRFKSISQLI